jgi:hypothetical protein
LFKRIKAKIKEVRRNSNIKRAQKARGAIEVFESRIKQGEVDRVSDLLRKKVKAKTAREKEEIDREIDMVAGSYTLKFIGIMTKEKPSEFLDKFAQIRRREKVAEAFGNKNDLETTRLHNEAEAALGDAMKYFDFVLLFPSIRTALVRKAQKEIAKKRWVQNELF